MASVWFVCVFKRNENKKAFQVDKLPVGKTIARYKDTYDHRCPSCYEDQEDRTHFLRCPHPDRTKWHLKLATAIRKRCEYLPTRPYLMEILISGLVHWFQDTAFPREDYPTQYHDLIDQQEHLGWNQLFLGRFSTLCGATFKIPTYDIHPRQPVHNLARPGSLA